MKIVYWILCVLGTLLPLAQFFPWLAEHGLNIPLMCNRLRYYHYPPLPSWMF